MAAPQDIGGNNVIENKSVSLTQPDQDGVQALTTSQPTEKGKRGGRKKTKATFAKIDLDKQLSACQAQIIKLEDRNRDSRLP